jgi:hypothetical protein
MRTPNIAQAISNYCKNPHKDELSKMVGFDCSSREGRLVDTLTFVMKFIGDKNLRSYIRGSLHSILKNPRYSHRRAG